MSQLSGAPSAAEAEEHLDRTEWLCTQTLGTILEAALTARPDIVIERVSLAGVESG